ncbi:hypothetical protein NR402_14440 [Acidithiobacillus ferrooxidans]|uniref:hypothetical protein n=1 Tax=Acidithiobacillus ferrooxidans TaxID=920 RepID=UPI00214CBC8C|nr:hypothetical protein [Acidithiobacillus ferrooxidans]MCR2831472.1 hypothetical protein [Acidithiobacillus ferrooxidans]
MKAANNLRMAVLTAILAMPVLATGGASAATASNAALANDAGVSQAEVQAGNSWVNSDQNSTGYQNSGQLQTGNSLGGQSQVQGSLAASQSAAATDPYFASVLARYYNLYNGYYDSYLTDESRAAGSSSAYSACVAKGLTNCLNKSAYYSGLAVTAYGQYRYYYDLWNKDWQQQQAMEATAGQQSVLSGASAQSSQQSYGNYQNDQSTMNADAQAAATDTQTANAGDNATAVSSGQQAASNALNTIQQETGVTQNQQSGTVPATPGASSFSYTDPLQTAMENANQAAMQDAQTSVIQQQYSDNRSADATTADQQSQADGAAASVAPTPESATIWSTGASLASGTANAYQQDANQTAATALQAQQSFVQNQNQANADAIQVANDTNAAAEQYAQQQAAKNGVTFTVPGATAPTISDTAVQNQIAQAQSAINADSMTAEVQAANAYSQQRIASDMATDANTASQQAQAAQSNASAAQSYSPSLAKTWNAVAGSETASASQAQQTALSATSAASTDIAAANAAEANAKQAAGSTGMDGAAITQGQNAAQAAFQAIQQATGVPQ